LDKAKLFAAAEKAVVKGQYDKAMESFEQLLKADPYDAKVLNRAADILLKKGDNAKGIEYLSRLGESYTRDGFFSKAVAIYKRILKIDNGATKESLVGMHEKLADLYGQLGLISDAMSHFSIVVDVYDRMADHESLLNVLKKVSDLDPYNIDSQLKLAELFRSQNRDEESDETFQRLTEHVNAKGHMPDVLRVYERWVELSPTNVQRLSELVDAYIRVNEPKKALAKIQLAFRADPRSPEVLELLSSTFSALKQPDKAKAVDVELIKIYRQAGDEDQAVRVEGRLRGNAPSFEESKLSKATVKSTSGPIETGALGDEIDPAESLIQGLNLDPDERKILSECDVYSKYGLNDKAHEVLTKSLSNFSQSIALRWRLSAVCFDKGLTEQAAHILSEVLMLAKAKKMQSWVEIATQELRKVDPQHPSLGGQSKSEPAVEIDNHATELELVEEVDSSQKPRSDTTQVEQIDFKDFEPSEISIVLEDEIVQPVVESTEEPQEAEEMVEPLLTEDDFSPDELSRLEDSLAPARPDESQVEVLEPIAASGLIDEPSWLQEQSASAPIDLVAEPVAEAATQVAVEPAVAVDADFEIRQALEEVEFFKAQGLSNEAEQLLKSLATKFPGHPLLNQSDKKAAIKRNTVEIEALGRKVKLNVQEDHRALDEDSFFDLAGELDAELEGEAQKFEGPREVLDVFNAFKQGVAQSVDEGDYQTHFDLGVAYREMGLLEDAISEFEIVAKTPGQKASACYQIGICEVARGRFAEAKEAFDRALQMPDLMNQEKISITYELADALLHLNDKGRAKKLFEEVSHLDPEFREVQDKIKLLA